MAFLDYKIFQDQRDIENANEIFTIPSNKCDAFRPEGVKPGLKALAGK